MGTEEAQERVEAAERSDEAREERLREELETAWLRGWSAREQWKSLGLTKRRLAEEEARMAADYAERVVGGSTRPARPHNVGREPMDELSEAKFENAVRSALTARATRIELEETVRRIEAELND